MAFEADYIEVDHLEAGRIMRESFERVSETPQETCPIKDTVDATLDGHKCLTYQYILLTALVAKLAAPAIDMLSLQIDDASSGAYAPRPLCQAVVYPFQKKILNDALDGSNPDPFVNKPARYPRLSKKNAAYGDGRKVLNLLCDNLPLLTNASEVRETLDYMMTRLVKAGKMIADRKKEVKEAVASARLKDFHSFLNDLLDQNFGGTALVLVSYALFLTHFNEKEGFNIIPHPVNQSGSSKRQCSDLDVFKDGSPFLGVELKDKQFVASDVAKACDSAKESGLKSLLFVAGRHIGMQGMQSISTYFSEVRRDYASKGFTVGIIGIDELMDFIISTHVDDIDASLIIEKVYDCIKAIGGTPETQTWVYSRLKSL